MADDRLLSAAEHRGVRKKKYQPSLLTVHCIIILVQVSFGGGSVVGRLGLPSTNPVLFALIREGIAGPCLCLMAYYFDRALPKLSDWKLFFWPGIALFFNQLFFIVGLKLSSSVTASAWQPSQPIMAVLIGYCIGTERNVDRYKVFGILFGTAGALFMVLYHAKLSENKSIWSEFGGSICFFINCLATTLYLIFAKRTLKKYPSATVTGYSYIWASFGMTVTAMVVGFSRTVLDFLCDDCNGHAWRVPSATIFALAYWIIAQSFLAYGLITWANQYADPSVNLAYTVLQPLTAAVVSEILISLGIVRQCHGSKDLDNTCLYGASMKDLGAIGIAIGLYCVIYSDKMYQQRLKHGRLHYVTAKEPLYQDSSSTEDEHSSVQKKALSEGPRIGGIGVGHQSLVYSKAGPAWSDDEEDCNGRQLVM